MPFGKRFRQHGDAVSRVIKGSASFESMPIERCHGHVVRNVSNGHMDADVSPLNTVNSVVKINSSHPVNGTKRKRGEIFSTGFRRFGNVALMTVRLFQNVGRKFVRNAAGADGFLYLDRELTGNAKTAVTWPDAMATSEEKRVFEPQPTRLEKRL